MRFSIVRMGNRIVCFSPRGESGRGGGFPWEKGGECFPENALFSEAIFAIKD